MRKCCCSGIVQILEWAFTDPGSRGSFEGVTVGGIGLSIREDASARAGIADGSTSSVKGVSISICAPCRSPWTVSFSERYISYEETAIPMYTFGLQFYNSIIDSLNNNL